MSHHYVLSIQTAGDSEVTGQR